MLARPARLFTRLALTPSLVSALVLAMLAVTSPAEAQRIRPNFFGMHDVEIAGGSVPGVPMVRSVSGTPDQLAPDRKGEGQVRLVDAGPGRHHRWQRATATVDRPGADPAVPRQEQKGAGCLRRRLHEHAEAVAVEALRAQGRAPLRQAGRLPDLERAQHHQLLDGVARPDGEADRYGQQADQEAVQEPALRKATVVAPAFPLRLKGQQKWYQSYWAQKVGGKSVATYVKVVSVNLYPLADQGPEASMKLLRFAKRVLPRAARGKPIWNTEINYGLLGGDTAKKISDARQAAYVARTLALNAASPVRRVFWYAWALGPIANTHLVENDRTSLTRAGRAWSVARGWIVGTNMKKCSQARSGSMKGVYTCTARKSKT